jgi:hypothetical protein
MEDLTELIRINLRKMETEPEEKHPERNRKGDQIPVELPPDCTIDDRVDESPASAEMEQRG